MHKNKCNYSNWLIILMNSCLSHELLGFDHVLPIPDKKERELKKKKQKLLVRPVKVIVCEAEIIKILFSEISIRSKRRGWTKGNIRFVRLLWNSKLMIKSFLAFGISYLNIILYLLPQISSVIKGDVQYIEALLLCSLGFIFLFLLLLCSMSKSVSQGHLNMTG